MRKKIILILMLCFIMITLTGCFGYKLSSFDNISLAKLKNDINKSTQSYNITLPDFKKFEASNGYSTMYDLTSIVIEVKTDGSQVIHIFLDISDEASSDMLPKYKEFLIIAYGVIATIDPGVDPSEIIDSLIKQNQSQTSKYTYSFIQDDRILAFVISK